MSIFDASTGRNYRVQIDGTVAYYDGKAGRVYRAGGAHSRIWIAEDSHGGQLATGVTPYRTRRDAVNAVISNDRELLLSRRLR